MDAKRISSGTRERLLEAAEWLTLRDGVAKMTLDAVSREAGVSKGGLLYHFPTKDALIGGMIERFIERFEGDIEKTSVTKRGPVAGFGLTRRRVLLRVSASKTSP